MLPLDPLHPHNVPKCPNSVHAEIYPNHTVEIVFPVQFSYHQKPESSQRQQKKIMKENQTTAKRMKRKRKNRKSRSQYCTHCTTDDCILALHACLHAGVCMHACMQKSMSRADSCSWSSCKVFLFQYSTGMTFILSWP